MLREILFRGKCKNDNKWLYGFPYVTRKYAVKINWYCSEFGSMRTDEVDPETVGQFTGLTDKNGVRIFEGDIVECWSEGVKARGTVQQRIDGLWIIYPAWQKHIMWGLCPDNDGHTTVEVIGNLHDNPELLKGGGDNG